MAFTPPPEVDTSSLIFSISLFDSVFASCSALSMAIFLLLDSSFFSISSRIALYDCCQEYNGDNFKALFTCLSPPENISKKSSLNLLTLLLASEMPFVYFPIMVSSLTEEDNESVSNSLIDSFHSCTPVAVSPSLFNIWTSLFIPLLSRLNNMSLAADLASVVPSFKRDLITFCNCASKSDKSLPGNII